MRPASTGSLPSPVSAQMVSMETNVSTILMNAKMQHVSMVEHALTASMSMGVVVLRDSPALPAK